LSSVARLETKTAKSAFDENEAYELTALGGQFVHYAMTKITVKLEYRGDDDIEKGNAANPNTGS
jgi:hypothetical protein